MITEMSTKIQPSNNYARIAYATSMSGGIALALLSTFIPLYKGIVSVFAVVLIAVAIAIYTKYVAVTYYYDITRDNNGAPIFVVRQVMGKRESTLCRIDLADIIKVENENAKERRAHKTPFEYRKYSYLPTLMPKNTVRLTVHGKYENAEIIIENENYGEVLKKYAEEARQTDFRD